MWIPDEGLEEIFEAHRKTFAVFLKVTRRCSYDDDQVAASGSNGYAAEEEGHKRNINGRKASQVGTELDTLATWTGLTLAMTPTAYYGDAVNRLVYVIDDMLRAASMKKVPGTCMSLDRGFSSQRMFLAILRRGFNIQATVKGAHARYVAPFAASEHYQQLSTARKQSCREVCADAPRFTLWWASVSLKPS